MKPRSCLTSFSKNCDHVTYFFVRDHENITLVIFAEKYVTKQKMIERVKILVYFREEWKRFAFFDELVN